MDVCCDVYQQYVNLVIKKKPLIVSKGLTEIVRRSLYVVGIEMMGNNPNQQSVIEKLISFFELLDEHNLHDGLQYPGGNEEFKKLVK